MCRFHCGFCLPAIPKSLSGRWGWSTAPSPYTNAQIRLYKAPGTDWCSDPDPEIWKCDNDPSHHLLGHSITYSIAMGSQQGRKVLTLQTLSDCESDNLFSSSVGEVAGFSLHAGVATKTNERTKLERLCRYITRPAVSTKRLSLTPQWPSPL